MVDIKKIGIRSTSVGYPGSPIAPQEWDLGLRISPDNNELGIIAIDPDSMQTAGIWMSMFDVPILVDKLKEVIQ